VNLSEASNLCLALMAKHELLKYNYTFSWINSKNVFGCHKGFDRKICLSRPLVLLNNEDDVRDTILHEIAHALVYIRNGFRYRLSENKRKCSHDDVWKKVCIEIGCKPKRCYNTEKVNCPEPKYELIHIATGKVIKRNHNKPNFEKYANKKYVLRGIISSVEWKAKK